MRQNQVHNGVKLKRSYLIAARGCGSSFLEKKKEPKKNRLSLSFAVLRIFGTSADLIRASAMNQRLSLLYMFCRSRASLSGARTKERQRHLLCRWRCTRKRIKSVIVRRISYKENHNPRVCLKNSGVRNFGRRCAISASQCST